MRNPVEKLITVIKALPTFTDTQISECLEEIEKVDLAVMNSADVGLLRITQEILKTEDRRRNGSIVHFEEQDGKLSTFIADSTEDDHHVTLIPLEKQEDEEMIVFGEVLVPDTTDAHGDTVSAEEIRSAAHLWLARFQDRGLQHAKIVNSKMELFESYIAPSNLTIGGRKVKKGTWLLMLHVTDEALWKEIKKGDFTGFSMGGFARRVKA